MFNDKENKIIKDVKISKKLNGNLLVKVEEQNILFYNSLEKKYVLENKETMDNLTNSLGIPTLINYTPNDIYENLYITPWDAALGAKLPVNGIDGELSILIPKGTQSGDKISIPNKGYYITEKERGNLVIETDVVIPKKLSEKEKELFIKLKKVSKFNPNNLVNIK